MKKILVVADVSNLYYCIKMRLGGKLDYQKYLSEIRKYGKIQKAIAYGADMDGQATEFKQALQTYGFEIKYKEPKFFPNKRKADWDVGIAIDIVEHLHEVDMVVIGSADSDMAPVVEHVQKHGKKVLIYACKISGDLMRICDTKEITINETT